MWQFPIFSLSLSLSFTLTHTLVFRNLILLSFVESEALVLMARRLSIVERFSRFSFIIRHCYKPFYNLQFNLQYNYSQWAKITIENWAEDSSMSHIPPFFLPVGQIWPVVSFYVLLHWVFRSWLRIRVRGIIFPLALNSVNSGLCDSRSASNESKIEAGRVKWGYEESIVYANNLLSIRSSFH